MIWGIKMKSNINEVIEQYVIKIDNGEDVIIIPSETVVLITTDGTDFEEKNKRESNLY